MKYHYICPILETERKILHILGMIAAKGICVRLDCEFDDLNKLSITTDVVYTPSKVGEDYIVDIHFRSEPLAKVSSTYNLSKGKLTIDVIEYYLGVEQQCH